MRTNKFGFTLIELLIVILVVGALASIAVFTFSGAQASARDAKRMADLKEYQNALELYANKNFSFYPVEATTVNASSICADLGVSLCPDDPKTASGGENYKYLSDTFSATQAQKYVLWARLEKTEEYFVVCSNGKTVRKPAASFSVSGGNCPP